MRTYDAPRHFRRISCFCDVVPTAIGDFDRSYFKLCISSVYRIICFDFHVKSARNVPTFRLLNNCKAVIDTRARRESSLLLPVVNNATITLRRVARYRHSRIGARLGVKIAEWRGSLL